MTKLEIFEMRCELGSAKLALGLIANKDNSIDNKIKRHQLRELIKELTERLKGIK